MKRQILMVVGNPATGPGGVPVGFWAAELTHPYFLFSEFGCEVTLASNDGGKVIFDAYSDPRHPSGHSSRDLVSLGFVQTPSLMAQLEATAPISSVSSADYDAIFVSGGSSPMFTFKTAKNLQSKFLEFCESGKPSSTICHGGALLLFLQRPNGRPFVEGLTFTASSNTKEDLIAAKLGKGFFPFRIEDEANRLGARFVANADPLAPFATRDGNVITGQQEHSGFETARLVIQALNEGT